MVEKERGIAEDRVIPSLQVRVVLDELWKRCPFIRWGDKARAIGSNGELVWISRLEGVLRPRKSRAVGSNKCGNGECGRISLQKWSLSIKKTFLPDDLRWKDRLEP